MFAYLPRREQQEGCGALHVDLQSKKDICLIYIVGMEGCEKNHKIFFITFVDKRTFDFYLASNRNFKEDVFQLVALIDSLPHFPGHFLIDSWIHFFGSCVEL